MAITPQRKKLAMMKTMKFLSMAALVLVGAITTGCTNEDENMSQSMPEPKLVTLTTTISMGGGGETRALTEEGVKTFAEGEQIAVVYTNTSSERVKALSNALVAGDITNEGKTARITVTLTDPVAGSVDYIYPAAMANEDGTPNLSALCMQDGTLPTLAAKLDYAKGSGTMTVSGSEYTLPGIALKNQLTICKFKVKNSGGREITGNITGLTVSDGTNTYTVSRAATAGPIYVAMLPVSSDKTISFVANDASDSYYKSVTGKALDVNNQYTINVTMEQGQTTNLSTLSADYVAQNGDMLTGKLLVSHKISIAKGATVILKNVSINYDINPALSGSFAGITCLGGATLIISGTENYVKGFSSGHPGIFVPTDNTLTITGNGTLYALGHEYGAGIGSGRYNITDYKACGNIVIQGGTVWATGGSSAAAIGSGASIIFTQYDPGTPSSCGDITVRNSVTHIYATKGSGAESIGKGQYSNCGTVTIEAPGKVTEH
jgi:hypothetical protein